MNNTTYTPQDLTEFYINEKIRLTLMVVSVVAGLIGNALVVFLILTKKKRRTNDDIFLLNLACADFLNIALDTGRFVVHLSYLRDDDGYPPSKTLMWCKIFWPLLSVPFCAGVYTITAMSIHRCWVILNPFKQRIRRLWIVLSILSTWAIPVIVYLPVSITSVNHDRGCIKKGWSKLDKKAFSIFTLIIQYPLPLLVVVIAYINICISLRRTRVSNQTRGDESREDSIAMTKTIGAIVLLFVILLLPLQVSKVSYHFGVKETWVWALWDYGDVLASLHSAINPYLYTILTPYYRKRILSWCRNRRRSESSSSYIASVTTTQGNQGQIFSNLPNDEINEVQLDEMHSTNSAKDEKPKEQGPENDSNAYGYDVKF